VEACGYNGLCNRCAAEKRLTRRSSSRSLNSLGLSRGAFTLSKLVLFVIGSPAQFRDRFRSLSMCWGATTNSGGDGTY